MICWFNTWYTYCLQANKSFLVDLKLFSSLFFPSLNTWFEQLYSYLLTYSIIHFYFNSNCSVSVINEESMHHHSEILYEVSTYRSQKGTRKLRMSRSFGDFYLKQNENLSSEKQAVIAVPDIVVSPRSIRLVLFCKMCNGYGYFNVMKSIVV